MQNNPLPESILRTTDGVAVPLEGVSVRGVLRDLTAEITVEQRYTNPREANIEAVYTFPLPVGAVLLGLELEIGKRRLTGQVAEKKAAEHRYEEAISNGDTAVMLEKTSAGLYTMNFGNLMAGESAVIRYRYAMVLSWQGEQLRLLLPTMLAPRYGNPFKAGLLSHQVPETSLTVDYPFDLEFLIEGSLVDSKISSPTHAIATSRTDTGVKLSLTNAALLDRDFVLLLCGCAKNAAFIASSVNTKGERVALVSLRLPELVKREEMPLNLKVMIDCSGSMAGVSIAQARKAALEILNQLQPGDHFNVTLFGSAPQHFWNNLVPVEAHYIAIARQKLEQMDANLGGTETSLALRAVYLTELPGSRMQHIKNKLKKKLYPKVGAGDTAQILLITDGQVWDYEGIVKEAQKSNHRVFTVGVGLAAVDGLVGELAQKTGGACELIAPQEGMTERVLAQFHRLRQPQVRIEGIRFEQTPTWMTPLPSIAYAGDTLHVYAGFGIDPASSCVTLTAMADNGQALTAQAMLEPTAWVDLTRIAAAARIAASNSEDEQRRWALEHQLLTCHTNFLVVAERADKAEDLPELAAIPHMLSAGWGGLGVDEAGITLDMVAIPYTLMARPPKSFGTSSPCDFVANLNTGLAGFLKTKALPTTIDALTGYGLPEEVAISLRELFAEYGSEYQVVMAFLMALLNSAALKDKFSRNVRRLIMSGWQHTAADTMLLLRLNACALEVRSDAWKWRLTLEPQATGTIM